MRYFFVAFLFAACCEGKPEPEVWWKVQSRQIQAANDSGVYYPAQHLNIDGSEYKEIRGWYYNADSFRYRPYRNKKEVYSYLNKKIFRSNEYDIYISNDKGNIEVYRFLNDSLVPKKSELNKQN